MYIIFCVCHRINYLVSHGGRVALEQRDWDLGFCGVWYLPAASRTGPPLTRDQSLWLGAHCIRLLFHAYLFV